MQRQKSAPACRGRRCGCPAAATASPAAASWACAPNTTRRLPRRRLGSTSPRHPRLRTRAERRAATRRRPGGRGESTPLRQPEARVSACGREHGASRQHTPSSKPAVVVARERRSGAALPARSTRLAGAGAAAARRGATQRWPHARASPCIFPCARAGRSADVTPRSCALHQQPAAAPRVGTRRVVCCATSAVACVRLPVCALRVRCLCVSLARPRPRLDR